MESAMAKWLDEDELEQIIIDLVRRKQAVEVDSAEYTFLQRQLNGLRYSYEGAGGIWEHHDPYGWGATPP